jgi:lipopolysaccharide assembly outer membrane protein LptD (OstA)
VQSFYLFAQQGKTVTDSLIIQKDTVSTDTIIKLRQPSKSAVDSKITYKAAKKIKRDLRNKQFILTKDAVINYGDIEIKADSIVINMNTNLLYAVGIKDTTGKITGKPSFKEGSNAFDSDELTYNFKTRKALIKNIVTKQDQGLLHSAFTKLLEDGTSNISRSTYSTCAADTPHFYISLPRARVYPGKKIISGPSNLVVEGIPLPLVIPFGFFPIQTKKAASGIIIPRYGEERIRGFSLTDGGYYFSISNYFDLKITGSIYSNGSWLTTAQTDYKKLYKYSGGLSFSYAKNVTNSLPNSPSSTNYRLGWTFAQDAKASPGSRFNASVNMSSSGYDQNNSYNVADHINTERQSSISYSKTWDGTPFNFAISANHHQNVKTKSVVLDLPKASFNVSRIYPFKSKNSSGDKWYEEIQLSYSASLDNVITTSDSLLFTSSVWKHMNNGLKQDIPLSLQFRPFNNFSISPSLTYSSVLYSKKIRKRYDITNINPATNQLQPNIIDTIPGLFYGQAVNPMISASYNPQIYGKYVFTGNSRLSEIRHVIKPSVSFSFVPSFAGLSTRNMYRQVQVNDTTYTKYSIYGDSPLFGTPAAASKSGTITLSLVNIVEAKVFAKNDTTGKPNKVKLIDNFSINTGYNIFADEFNWSLVRMDLRTSLMKNINISATSNFSLYDTDEKGVAINKFLLVDKHRLMRLTDFNTGLDFSLSQLLSKNKDKAKTNTASTGIGSQNQNFGQSGYGMPQDAQVQQPENPGKSAYDKYGYPVFDMPWTLNVRYSLNYRKGGLSNNLTQTLSFDGSVTITPKMSATFTSGYDFNAKQITYSNVGISRDLHCWTMNLNWVPIGTTKGWNFAIRVKASVLGDLKYERRKDFHDTY